MTFLGRARADLKPRVENSDLGASVQPTILVHGRIRHAKDPLVHVRTRHASKGLWVVNQLVGYPGRPRGGLIIVPSRHLFQQVPTPPHTEYGKRTLQERCSRPKRIPSAFGSFGGETQRVCPLSRVPLLALFPSRPSTPWPHALWIYVARPSSRVLTSLF